MAPINGIRIVTFLMLLSSVAASQETSPEKRFDAGVIVPTTIAFIPPVARAVLTRDPSEVYTVLEKREKVDERVRAKDGERAGFTPLILAAAVSDQEIAGMLLKYGANVTLLDDFNRSAFWYAALTDNVGLTRVLTSAKGGREVINVSDDDLKRTPLHIAVRGDDPELVQLLLSVGASKDQKDILGETPVEYCKRRATSACQSLK